jgi:Zn-finger nucleic acid-binding protein
MWICGEINFSVSAGAKQCPVCRAGLVQVKYDESKTRVDFCKMCGGIWLDRGEFKQIINYLKSKSDYQILHHYAKNLVLQLWEVFNGPGQFRDELEDFLTLLKLFNYKFEAQHEHLTNLIAKLKII